MSKSITIEHELEYAYNAWKGNNGTFSDDTAKSLRDCMNHTACSEIDRTVEQYPSAFIAYIDEHIANV